MKSDSTTSGSSAEPTGIKPLISGLGILGDAQATQWLGHFEGDEPGDRNLAEIRVLYVEVEY